ncbi:TIGR03364 family FAD-dependent oxidoreductase [Frondihabitans australicus]|uniref:FAD dependent oxidoreductase TIGR03364 n=1 Tax=Frondihabitans australicus TaxID=386892 RepID=A0A495IFZ5_9MICO|nr:TIGR03364 family FAD-dependent oxidoreductase [Frondihabitans australicus]RKR74570.1 FAD dependent oxidoreductase TIGR03364 [Frondihabitans australicus]
MSTPADRTADIAIVGAGIVGLGHALAAVDRGLRVIVIERGSRQNGASIRNFGHACISVQSGVAQEYADRARELWLRLRDEAGLWMRDVGGYVVARHEDELAAVGEFVERRPGDARLLSPSETAAATGADPAGVVGGAHLLRDLQVNPREALFDITRYLESRGVEFHFTTAVRRIEPRRLETTRGTVEAERVVVAVNYDVDQVFPELGERYSVRRCGLDMTRVAVDGLRAPLAGPVLTGWSMLRYSGFAASPSLGAVRDRLHSTWPSLADLDLNQMYTQLPDGTVIVGDTHYRDDTVTPFQQEHAFSSMLEAAASFFGVGASQVRVLERWQGVYASAPEEFLVDEVVAGVHVVSVTTGIGMTTGLGLADRVIASLYEGAAV